MKKLTFAATLGLLGLLSRSALAAPGDTLSPGDPEDLFTITDYVASDTALITAIPTTKPQDQATSDDW